MIEPLESVSVGIIPTEKASVTEFGDLKEVALTLADKVLTSPNQEVNLLATSEVRGGAWRGMLGEQRLAGGAAGPAAVQRRAARAETPPPPLCSAVVAARGGRAHVL